MESFIQLDSVTKDYPLTRALDGVSVQFPASGMVFIKGESGCGKTTLLNLLGGLDSPSEGTIAFEGKITKDFDRKQWDDYRNRRISFVFQDYNLLDEMTVADNISLGLDIQDQYLSEQEKTVRIAEVLDFVGLPGFAMRKVSEMSGGQKQRVAIARAVAKQSCVILADEPTGNLDSENSRMILALLKKVSEKHLVIIVTHDVAAAIEYGDRIITISDGRIIEDLEISNRGVQKRYSITISDGQENVLFSVDGECIAPAKEKLAAWLLGQGGKHQYAIEIQETQLDEHTLAEAPLPQEKTVRARPLPFARRIHIARLNMAKSRVRLVLSAAMFALTIFLLLMASFVMTYDRTDSIGKYLQRQDASAIYLYENKSYENPFFEEKTNQIFKGEQYYQQLQELFPELSLVPRYMEDMLVLEQEEGKMAFANKITLAITDNPQFLDRELMEGRYPQNGNEIALTDYVAKYLLGEDQPIGKTVRAGSGIPMTVVGIIQTDCEEKEIALRAKWNDLNEFEQFDLQNVYQFAMTGTGFVDLMKAEETTIRLSKSNFLISDKESRYLEATLNFGSQSLVDGSLLWGRMPANQKEVLISFQLASNVGLEEKDLGQAYAFLDIHDAHYGGTYSDTLNMHRFFPEGVTVVGVYNAGALTVSYTPDVLIQDAIYRSILESYYSYYCYEDYVLVPGGKDLQALTVEADAAGFRFREPAIEKIYGFQQVLENLSDIIIILFVVVMLITVFMLYTYISHNIKVNTKKIGVLKAIGVKTDEIASIFLIEATLISIVSYCIAALLSVGFIFYVNDVFVDQIQQHEIEYIYWNWEMAAAVVIFAVGLGAASCVFPLIKLARKKPVEIIRTSL